MTPIHAMDNLWIVLVFTLGCGYRVHGSTPEPVLTNLLMTFLEGAVYTSPHFPSCGLPATYNITCRHGDRQGYMRLVFSAIDIPPDSILSIHDGMNVSAPFVAMVPRYVRSGWTRPVVLSQGSHLFVNYTPGSCDRRNHTGFQMELTCRPDQDWRLNQPVTDCPPVRDAMDGGYIEVTRRTWPWPWSKFEYDCSWLVKVPPGFQGLTVYVHVLAASRDVVVKEERTRFLSQIQGYMNSPMLFTSNKGLDVRMKKSVDTGYFTFIYGVFKNSSSMETCNFAYGGTWHQGFWCHHDNWCLPITHLCNNLQNCPNGHDEEPMYCQNRALLKTSLGEGYISSYPCDAICLDGTCRSDIALCHNGCLYNEQSCGNGLCVGLYERCPRTLCNVNEKMCRSGVCVPRYERCYEDSCPPYKSFRCAGGTVCLYETELCDGHIDCPSGEDEGGQRCAEGSFFTLYTVLGFLVFPFFMTCLACKMAIRIKPPPRVQEERERRLRQRMLLASRRPGQSIRLNAPPSGIRAFAHQYPPGEAPDFQTTERPLVVRSDNGREPPQEYDVMATERPLVVRSENRRELPPEYDSFATESPLVGRAGVIPDYGVIDLLPPSYEEATQRLSCQGLPSYNSVYRAAQQTF